MADFVDPFDDPNYSGQPQQGASPGPAQTDAISPVFVDRFDDPDYMPGGVYPRAELPNAGGPGETLTTGQALNRMGASVRSTVLGEGRMESPDLPDIDDLVTAPDPTGEGPMAQLPSTNRLALAAGIAAASEPAQVVDIALAQLPGSSARKDAMGNPIIDWNGLSMYAWKPGIRGQDVRRMGAQAIPYMAATNAGLQMGGGILSRVMSIFGMNAGTSALLDTVASMAGSEQGVSAPRAIMVGTGGVAGEALSPAANSAFRKFGGANVLDDAGRLRPDVADELRRRGYDFTDEQARLYAQMMRESTDPDAAARYAQSQGLDVPVPETMGTATMDPGQQMFENQAAEGAFGSQASNLARGIQANQREAIRQNVPAIQSRLAGGRPNVLGKGDAGAQAQANLLAQQGRARGAVDTLYNRARATPAVTSGAGVDEFVGRLNAAAGDIVRLDDAVRIKLSDLRERAAAGDVPVEELFNWRRDVSRLKNSTNDATRAEGLGSMLKAFDDNVDDVIRQSLLAGDEESARMWLKAVKGRRAMGRRYGANDLVEDLLETEYGGKSPRLKVPPEAASNYIMGKSNIPFANKPELVRDIVKLKKVLGQKSPEWNAIREEVFLRFGDLLEGGLSGDVRQVSGAKFLNGWEKALRDNGPVMRTVFSDDEIRRITQLGRVSARITNPVRGGRNFSGTSQGLAAIVRKFNDMMFVGPKGQALLSKLLPQVHDYAQGWINTNRVTSTMSGTPGTTLPLRQPVPSGALGAAGAQAGREAGNYLSPGQ